MLAPHTEQLPQRTSVAATALVSESVLPLVLVLPLVSASVSESESVSPLVLVSASELAQCWIP